MNYYQCSKCYKQLSSKQNLDYHISHNVCVSKYVCPRCHVSFSSKRILDNHIQREVCLKKPKLTLKNQQVNQTVEQLTLENLQLKGEIKALKENPQTVNNNTNQINIVVPPAFLTVDNSQQLTRILPNLLHIALSKHPANFISYLIKETNCNPRLPLYNSIKITNKKDPYAQISDGDKYVYASKKKIITQLIENKRHILQEYVDNHGDKYGEKILNRYQRYVDYLDDDKEAVKELEIDIICMILNASEVIGSDDWSKKLINDLKDWSNTQISHEPK